MLLDREATLERAASSIAEAAEAGAALLVFPEAYVPGSPTSIRRLRPGGDMGLSSEIHARLRRNSVGLSRGGLQPVLEAAGRHGATIVLGINEIDGRFSGTTLFNSVAVVGPDGTLRNRHRKLCRPIPNGWCGDAAMRAASASSIRRPDESAASSAGRATCPWRATRCMRRASRSSSTWDYGETCLATWRHVAKEAGAWVIGTATALQGCDVPDDFPQRERLFGNPDEWINDGDATIVQPGGTNAAGPLHRDKGILYGEIDVGAAKRARRSLDLCGHYARPDLFSLTVNRKPLDPVTSSD